MKQILLLVASLLMGVGVNAQFLESNASEIGDQETLFLLDSNATDYAFETGASAAWDYSSTTGYNSETRDVEVVDPSSTANAANFTSSQKAYKIESLLTSYLTEDNSGQKSQGFYMNEPTTGELLAVFDIDEQELYQYPLNLNDNFTDHYEGSFDLDNPILGQITGDVVGDVTVTFDGEGDLQLVSSTYNNVMRYKLMDEFVLSFTQFGNPFEISVERVQYEYYDFTVGKLPIFIHSTLNITPPSGFGLAPTENSIVVSLEDPITSGLTSNDVDQTLVYPNPANKELNVQFPSAMDSGNITINDAVGREVYAANVLSNMTTIDVSQFNKGVYFVKIKGGTYASTKRIVIK